MTRCMKRYLAAVFAVLSMMLCLCIQGGRYQTVYAEDTTEAVETEESAESYDWLHDPRDIQESAKGHYWTEYFITLKSITSDFKATVGTVLIGSLGWIGICCLIMLIGMIGSTHLAEYDKYSSNLWDLGPIISDGCSGGAFSFAYKLSLISLVLSPFISDVKYLRMCSNAGWGKAIISALFFGLIKIAVGLIAGIIVYLIVSSVFKIISEKLGTVLGLISGTVVFLLFNIVSVVMAAWIPIE